jgi:hypothetical protein
MKKNSLVVIVLLFHFISFGQIHKYDYKRDLSGIKDTWHSIEIPDEMFEKIDYSMNDIRLYGINGKDTIEAPFFSQIQQDIITSESVDYELINKSKTSNGYYYTLEINSDVNINSMDLEFSHQNYDWQILLEGSHDQLSWFTLVDQYRVLSIHNSLTKYTFNRLVFPTSDYRFYRVFVPSSFDPGLISPKITHTTHVKGKTRDFKIVSQNIKEENKETVITINFDRAVPLNEITFSAKEDFDYYRPISIDYLTDSTKTEKGYILNYSPINSGVFSSIEKNNFYLYNTVTNNLRITVQNHDNQALTFTEFSVNGYIHELVARFTEDGDYMMVYGRSNAIAPNYDIDHFTNNIPTELSSLELGDEIAIKSNDFEEEKDSPLFENPMWLWVIMGIVILVLGWFTLKMLKSESGNKEQS